MSSPDARPASFIVRVWAFRPRSDRLDEFHQRYGPEGSWAALFRRADGFLGTTLVAAAGSSFLTLDRWSKAESFDAFLQAHRAEYDALDRDCEGLLEEEREVATLRAARSDDASAIADLCGELGYPARATDVRARLDVIERREDELVLVAESPGGTIAGWIHVFSAIRIESAPYAELGGLVVTADLRGKGIGQALVSAAEAWAHERGIGDMRVRSNVIRERAHDFYQRQGYRLSKTQKVFVKPLNGG